MPGRAEIRDHFGIRTPEQPDPVQGDGRGRGDLDGVQGIGVVVLEEDEGVVRVHVRQRRGGAPPERRVGHTARGPHRGARLP
ncbi:hypothetical protein [Streptomyces sp. NPDC000880]